MTEALDRAIRHARDVRADLLRRADVRRDLRGQCGLAAMRVAVALGTPEALRIGFYLRHETFCGQRGRYPNQHAWCQVDDTIIDPTATQFGLRRAVHVAVAVDDDHYIETARGVAAADEILVGWCCGHLPEYKQLAKTLRQRVTFFEASPKKVTPLATFFGAPPKNINRKADA